MTENRPDMLGKRYFGILMGDVLKLFAGGEEEASRHMEDPTNIWENKPTLELAIFRNSKDGILMINQEKFNFVMLFNDNNFKCNKVKVKVTLDMEHW